MLYLTSRDFNLSLLEVFNMLSRALYTRAIAWFSKSYSQWGITAVLLKENKD